jgi:hypothetical protein
MSARPNVRKAKPYCKVCHDSGLSETKYTSHFVRDKPGSDGVVVCPTILSLVCKYCEKTGHTSSRCQKLAQQERERGKRDHESERALRAAAWNAENANKKSSLKTALNGTGRFAELCGDSDSDSEPVKPAKKSESNAPTKNADRNFAMECIATQRAILQKLDIALTPKTKPQVALRIPVKEMDWSIESDDDDDL